MSVLTSTLEKIMCVDVVAFIFERQSTKCSISSMVFTLSLVIIQE